ncbi:MAG TPA: NAD-dependent epimerase/dehydratase family protein [Oligoflexia bacterium]|nr:NAD-dependent epimerase/dehydratase family protein [Oligoflexia bacterium]HMR25326.1 NAD-dependent epimerase/dehydratase family protein [Oligoflexia bacterium]
MSSKHLENKKILITGGAGFIGSHLVQLLCENNHVTILDNFSRDALKNTQLAEHPNVSIIKGDVCVQSDVEAACKDKTHVIHLASIAGVDTVLKKPVETMTIALLGTYNILEASKKQNSIERVIDFSTSEVFGTYAYKVTEGNATSLGAVGEARWTYAVSKLATEHLAHNYWRQYGLPTCSVRPFNIFGPNQVGEGAIHRFITRALHKQDLEIHNDGDQIRSWCYIDDIIDGILLCLTVDKAVGEAFNIGNPQNTLTIYGLAKEIIRLSESDSDIKFKTWDQQDVELRIPDINKAKELLQFQPKFDLETGLNRTIEWYRKKLA